jgi:hypothetical protein
MDSNPRVRHLGHPAGHDPRALGRIADGRVVLIQTAAVPAASMGLARRVVSTEAVLVAVAITAVEPVEAMQAVAAAFTAVEAMRVVAAVVRVTKASSLTSASNSQPEIAYATQVQSTEFGQAPTDLRT